MKIPYPPSVQTKDEARDLAIEWQNWQSEQTMSWQDVADWQNFFKAMGHKFDLTDEFKENGIL